MKTIGRSVRLKLQETSTEVYAKIDTGAYYSSIDADTIEVNGDKLTYRLFREGREGFTEEKITTQDFKMLTTRSSNGSEQIRPLIKLTVELAGQSVTEWFSLASREKMFYPVLVGRNILKDGFLVDVTKGQVASWDTSEF